MKSSLIAPSASEGFSACIRTPSAINLCLMKFSHVPTVFPDRHPWMAVWVRVVCVVFLCIVQATLMNTKGGRQNASRAPNGLTALPLSEGTGSFACGTMCFEADALLPRAIENDPFLAFLLLTVAITPSDRICSDINPFTGCTGAMRHPPPRASFPHLLTLTRSVQLLC